MFVALRQVAAAIEIIKSPDGTKDAPSRTCRDLALAHPEMESGQFF